MPYAVRSQENLAHAIKLASCKAQVKYSKLFQLSLLMMQTSDSSNLPHSRQALSLSSRRRQAWFNDYTVSIPLGVANGAAGILSLPFKVVPPG